jgi:hypothetical protein
MQRDPTDPQDDVTRLQLRSASEAGVCPSCGKELPKGGGTGSGSLDDGLFCSLDCFAAFHGPRIWARHVRQHRPPDTGDEA